MSDYPRMLLVREDIIREAEERIGIRFANKTKCADALEDLKRQIREAAIEEYKDRLLELCDCGSEQVDCTGGNCYKCMDNQIDYSSIVDLADELKGAI